MLGHRLKTIRTAKRFTKEALAKESGISRTTIYKIETGSVSPTVETLSRLLEVLGVSESVFFDRGDNLNYQ